MPSFEKMYPTRLGRDVYNDESLTGKARTAIGDLIDFVLADAQLPNNLPLPPRELTERLIADGGVAAQNPGENPTFLDDVFCPDKRTIHQYQRQKNGTMNLQVLGRSEQATGDMQRVYTKEMRVYRLQSGTWKCYTVTDMIDPDLMKTEPDKDVPDKPEAELVAYPNGRGLLYWGQHIYNRIEEIAHTNRWVLRLKNLLPIFTGNTGTRANASTAFNEAENAIVFPGAVEIHRMVTQNIIHSLIKESDEKREDFRDALKMLDKESVNRPVAADRELRMMATRLFVRNMRTKINEVYALIDPQLQIEFEPFVVKSADERLKELDLYDRLLAKQVMKLDEYNRKARALGGLRDLPSDGN